MNIGLDYDGTITRDPVMFRSLVDMFFNGGHRVYIVTSRGSGDPIETILDNIHDTVYCGFYSKKSVCDRMGILIDIWIDDMPYWIHESFIK